MLFKLSNLNSNLALTLGYLNPALDNSVMIDTLLKITVTGQWNQPRDNGVVSEFPYKSGTSWEKCPGSLLTYQNILFSLLRCTKLGSLYVCGKQLTYPSPKPNFCP